MKKPKKFVVLQVTFCATERLSLPSTFRGLKEFGIEATKIQWKSANCLKVRVGIDQPEHVGKFLATRESAVSAVVNKAQGYFKNAFVVATYGQGNH